MVDDLLMWLMRLMGVSNAHNYMDAWRSDWPSAQWRFFGSTRLGRCTGKSWQV